MAIAARVQDHVTLRVRYTRRLRPSLMGSSSLSLASGGPVGPRLYAAVAQLANSPGRAEFEHELAPEVRE